VTTHRSGPPVSRAAGPPDRRTAGPPDRRTAGPLAAGPPGHANLHTDSCGRARRAALV